MMVSVVMITSINVSFARKNETDSSELSDEEWDKIKDEFTDLDNLDDDWDHVTWDDEHKELAWYAFAGTEWTEASFPSLNFTEFGSSTVATAYLTEEEKANIASYVKTYKSITGTFSKKDATTGEVDNSAYIPLVIACMDTLKSKGYGDDPYAIQQYVSGGNVRNRMYTTEVPNYEKNISLLIYRRLIYAERNYNNTHSPDYANIYKAYTGSAGLYMMIQGVVYTESFARSLNGYSESVAADWFNAKHRGSSGYSQWNDFATLVMGKYSPTETRNNYMMDGFGKKLEYD